MIEFQSEVYGSFAEFMDDFVARSTDEHFGKAAVNGVLVDVPRAPEEVKRLTAARIAAEKRYQKHVALGGSDFSYSVEIDESAPLLDEEVIPSFLH